MVTSTHRYHSVLTVADDSIQHHPAPSLVAASNESQLPLMNRNVTAGYIHLGKTSGSTLTGVIRNSCHSFMRDENNKCRGHAGIEKESAASELVTSYYHVPDVKLIPTSQHDYYYVSVRDPLERFQSAFTSTHPLNLQVTGDDEKRTGIRKRQNHNAFRCFPTLDKFARYLESTNNNNNNNTCSKAARAAVNGKKKIMVHLWADYRKMVAPIPARATVFVIRSSHLWDDWVQINKLLDPTRDVYIPYSRHERNVQNLTLPVTRDISDIGRVHLCDALQDEYRIYFDVLERAVNMNASDIKEAENVARRNCPNLTI